MTASTPLLTEGVDLIDELHTTTLRMQLTDAKGRRYTKSGPILSDVEREEETDAQVRRALEAFSDTRFTDFDPFKAAYADLSAKLRPQVFELGFLPS